MNGGFQILERENFVESAPGNSKDAVTGFHPVVGKVQFYPFHLDAGFTLGINPVEGGIFEDKPADTEAGFAVFNQGDLGFGVRHGLRLASGSVHEDKSGSFHPDFRHHKLAAHQREQSWAYEYLLGGQTGAPFAGGAQAGDAASFEESRA